MDSIIYKHGILVGLGSVGTTYFEHMINRYDFVHVIEIDKSKWKKCLAKNMKNVMFYLNTHDLAKKITFENKICVAVIANWGPDHLKTYLELSHIGVKKFIIEKPMVSSKSDSRKLLEHSKTNSTTIIPSMPRRFSKLPAQLKELLHTKCGGEPFALNVFGGSQCIATNGIHWLDLSIILFDSFPLSVFTNLSNSELNPRNKNLGFYDGSSTWIFSNSRKTTITFSRHSYYRPHITILGKTGIVTVDSNGRTFVESIEGPEFSMDEPTTRVRGVGKALEVKFEDETSPFLQQLIALESNQKTFYSLETGLRVLDSLFAAFESSQLGEIVKINSSTRKYHLKNWMIS